MTSDNEIITLNEYQELTKPKNKFFAKRTEVDGRFFDSKREAERYRELLILERCGSIKNLTLQPEFWLTVNGVKICRYRADFSYFCLKRGEPIVEDVKSKATKTPVYELKRKIFEAMYGRKVTEIF